MLPNNRPTSYQSPKIFNNRPPQYLATLISSCLDIWLPWYPAGLLSGALISSCLVIWLPLYPAALLSGCLDIRLPWNLDCINIQQPQYLAALISDSLNIWQSWYPAALISSCLLIWLPWYPADLLFWLPWNLTASISGLLNFRPL